MRDRLVVALIGAFALSGCIGETPAPPVPFVDTRMPVTVDYRARPPLDPPPPREQGRVNPLDTRPTKVEVYGPDSRLESVPGLRDTLVGALERFRAQEPRGASSVLGLAKRSRGGHAVPIQGPVDEPDDAALTDAVDGSAERERAEPRGAAADRARGRRQAELGPDAVKDQDGGYSLNFEDAEVKDVLQAVLGKVLHLNYTVAPNLTGRITISSAGPLNRTELLSTLEAALAMQGLTMTPTGSGYRIAPNAVGAGAIDTNGRTPGFGVTVVPLEFTSGGSMLKLLSGFVSDADGVRLDATHNAIVVRGPSVRREEIVRAIKNFDSDWMHQQAVSVVELRRSKPDEVIGELNRIFDSDLKEGDAAGTIQFKAIRRLRAIMVISRNPQLVRRADQWIRRLDHQDTSATQNVYVYRPRYRSARELVRLVNNLFGGGGDKDSVAYREDQPFGADQAQAGGSQTRSIGQSSSSFAGGLSSGGLGGGNGSAASASGGGFGGSAAGGLGIGGGPAGGGGIGGAGPGGSAAGLGGNLAEPVEAARDTGDKSKLSVTADTGNNTVVAYTDGDTYRKIASVLRQLDLPPLQVAINVTVAEVQLNDALKYGVQFYLNNNPGQISLQQTANQAISIYSTIRSFGAYGGYNNGYGYGGIGLGGLGGIGGTTGQTGEDVILTALDSVSKVHILSRPSIVVMENKPATFEVGNQVPVTTQSATSTIGTNAPTLNQVQYLDTGVILKIIPRVGQKGEVDMDLDQIISAVVPDNSGAQSLTPTISKRRVASNISVTSGQAVMLAGLIQEQRQKSRAQLPFLGNEIGNLIGNTDNAFTRSELVIFIRPEIIRNGKDAEKLTEEYKSQVRTIDIKAPPVYKD